MKRANRKYGPDNVMWKGDNITKGAGYCRAHRIFKNPPERCARCGLAEPLQRHHLDHDPRHNSTDNIQWLCTQCHHDVHPMDRFKTTYTLHGTTKTQHEWAAAIGLSVEGLRKRLRYGWPLERALTAPNRLRH
jgi:hypothetical protein